MKHPLIVLGSAGGLLILGGMVWAYFFLFYQPSTDTARVAENPFVEVDAGAFGTRDDIDDAAQEAEDAAVSPMLAVTERRVVGAVGIGGGIYRFVEAGTGHAYQAVGGSEQKISNTTYAQAHDAVWSRDGSRVAISYTVDGVLHTALPNLDQNSGSSTESEIVGSIHSIAWSEDGTTLRFVRDTDKGSAGIAYDPIKKTEKVEFQTPLREVTVLWEDTPLIVTRAARSLMGYAYRSDMTQITEGMSALRIASHDEKLLVSGFSGGALVSSLIIDGITTRLDVPVIPEKCALVNVGIVCASPKSFDQSRYPDYWYRGEDVYDDEVRLFDATTGESRVIGDLSTPFRAPLDIVRVEQAIDGALMLSRDGHLVRIEM